MTPLAAQDITNAVAFAATLNWPVVRITRGDFFEIADPADYDSDREGAGKGYARSSLIELIAQGSPRSVLFLECPNVATDFLDWSPIQKRFVKRLFSVLIFAKRFIDRFRVGGGDER
jgi:hypothetical protein